VNIKEAKNQIEQAVKIYLTKDEYGNYRIPLEKQRPVFLIGAPGIGKTAIMEQIARELDLALVSYSMTHHTRQSAIGLPFIVHKTYGGEEYDVSMYTMSEIIASVYESMEKSGKKEGILFLDEINCVSETLGPSMLQFLQYKTFGNHAVPRGWVVVTAGNPPEYNRSVREFDVVTLDRLKVLEVEPDYDEWKIYAQQNNLHKAILTYLDIKKEDFYDIETTADGKNYVTARGWEDLSQAIVLYEENGFPVDEALVSQYIHNRRITGEFSAYYELYNKYRTDYQIQDILTGSASAMVQKRAKKASFDERISIMGLLLEALLPQIKANIAEEEDLKLLLPRLRSIKEKLTAAGSGGAEQGCVTAALENLREELAAEMKIGEAGSGLTEEQRRSYQYRMAFAAAVSRQIRLENPAEETGAFKILSGKFAERVEAMQRESALISAKLSELFRFVEQTFGDGNEMLILVTELTVNYSSAKFIAEKGCDAYYKYNRKFLLYERNRELMDELNALAEREKSGEDLMI
jgi:hypothetical protein